MPWTPYANSDLEAFLALAPIVESSMYPENGQAAVLLRNWLEDEGGVVNSGSLSVFYARYPLHAHHVKGRLRVFVSLFPQLFELTPHQDNPDLLVLSLRSSIDQSVQVGPPSGDSDSIANALERYPQQNGGSIRNGNMAAVYNSVNHGNRFPGGLREFVSRYPNKFHLTSRDLILVVSTSSSQTNQGQIVDPDDARIAIELEAFLQQCGGSFHTGNMTLVYDSVNQGRPFQGGLKKFFSRFPHKFRMSNGSRQLLLLHSRQE